MKTEIKVQPDGTITDLNGTPFEDQDRVKDFMPNDAWGRTPIDTRYNPDTILSVDLPEFEEVRKINISVTGDKHWIKVDQDDYNLWSKEKVTVLRFLETQKPESDPKATGLEQPAPPRQ